MYGLYEYNPIGAAGVPSSTVYAPTTAGYALLDSMAAAGTISKTNLGILEKYAPPTGAAVRTTPVNGVAIPYGIYSFVSPSFSNNYNYVISSDYNLSEKDQLRGRYLSNKTVGLDIAAALPVFYYPQPGPKNWAP